MILGCQLLREGGAWLGAVRSYIQRRFLNGEEVKWGTHDELKPVATVKHFEEAAAEVAATERNAAKAREKALREENTKLRAEWETRHRLDGKEYWMWQTDGGNELGSLAAVTPVVIRARDLRVLLDVRAGD